MSNNELLDIAKRLQDYNGEGWQIIASQKLDNGAWAITIEPVSEKKEVNND